MPFIPRTEILRPSGLRSTTRHPDRWLRRRHGNSAKMAEAGGPT